MKNGGTVITTSLMGMPAEEREREREGGREMYINPKPSVCSGSIHLPAYSSTICLELLNIIPTSSSTEYTVSLSPWKQESNMIAIIILIIVNSPIALGYTLTYGEQ